MSRAHAAAVRSIRGAVASYSQRKENIKGSGVFDLLRQRHAPIVAVAVSLQGPVSPRVFTQRKHVMGLLAAVGAGILASVT